MILVTHAPLARSFFLRDTISVARDLLGKTIIRNSREGMLRARIVETEAYLSSGDEASHSARGKTQRNASMFARGGTAYVYTIHARCCFNVVTEEADKGCAVLVRAVEPLSGVERMRALRGLCSDRDLTRGPARSCEALGIGLSWDGWDLTTGRRLWVCQGDSLSAVALGNSVRIGISRSQELLYRFFVKNNRFVSGPQRLNHV